MRLPSEFAYLQYVGKYPGFGQTLRVPALRGRELCSPDEVAASPTSYYILSDCNVLLEDERFRYLGSVPSDPIVPTMRRRFYGGWKIIDHGSETFVPNPIGTDISALSIEEGLPPDVIVERLTENWSPANDAFAPGPGARPRRRPAPSGPRETRFFLEFPDEDQRTSALEALRAAGFVVDVASLDPDRVDVVYQWADGDTLDAVDAFEIEIVLTIRAYNGEVTGRETSI